MQKDGFSSGIRTHNDSTTSSKPQVAHNGSHLPSHMAHHLVFLQVGMVTDMLVNMVTSMLGRVDLVTVDSTATIRTRAPHSNMVLEALRSERWLGV